MPFQVHPLHLVQLFLDIPEIVLRASARRHNAGLNLDSTTDLQRLQQRIAQR